MSIDNKKLAKHYLENAGQALLRATMVFDYAVSAEKMMIWSNLGDHNEAWQTGPYLSAGANEPQIDRTRPYCLRLSLENSAAISMVLKNSPIDPIKGTIRLPMIEQTEDEWRVESVIAKLIIIEQFEWFKDFSKQIGGPIDAKSSKAWRGCVEDKFLDRLGQLTDRRNALTHDADALRPTMKEAIEYFYSLTWITQSLVDGDRPSLNDPS